MNQHQERTAAVRHLVDEARRIEQNGVNYTTLEKIGSLIDARNVWKFPSTLFVSSFRLFDVEH